MNTHVLIPIKDIEDKIKGLKEVINFRQNIFLDYPEQEKELYLYKNLLNLGEQISLNENDIEEKAKLACKNIDDFGFSEKGYKQALKDLLKYTK